MGHGPHSLAELLVVYVTFGLYLGWVCVATEANGTAAAVGTGVRLGEADRIVAVIVLLVAGAIGVFLSRKLPGQYAIGVAMAWGLAWIAIGRLMVQPQSLLVVWSPRWWPRESWRRTCFARVCVREPRVPVVD